MAGESGLAAATAVAVAFSGGRDSTALLHAVWRALADHGGGAVALHALHVQHGLSPQAETWLRQCAARCRQWSRRGPTVHFHARRLGLQPRRGESVEAVARAGRYAALADMARAAGCRLILLGQHADDQAETFLLQALRGAGPAGLAAMPSSIERDGLLWCRPWLGQPRTALEAYLRRHRLRWIDDESNDSPAFARNRLRRQVWPALEAAFPDLRRTLAQASRRAQDAANCLRDLAAIDLAGAGHPDGGLDLAALVALGAARLRNALRVWLRQHSGRAAPASLLDRLADELTPRGSASWPLDARWRLVARAGRLQLEPLAERPTRSAPGATLALSLAVPGCHALPGWSGRLRVLRAPPGEAGLPAQRLADVRVRPRTGGEQFQRAAGTPARALKKQFQAAGVPPEGRDGPLVFDAQGQLLFVAGLGADARGLQAGEGADDQGLQLHWLPDGESP